jgi:predicted 3-demethylubiquinone-9 3-methyltransferase (glyoxalase superfamily)
VRKLLTIHPFLWFDNEAEEAAEFYVSVFPNSEIQAVIRMESPPRPEDGVVIVTFILDGMKLQALNGGPANFRFNESMSFLVWVETQAEIDYLWERLTAGGTPGQSGWLKDKYGLSWQIIPRGIDELLTDPDPERANRVMQALLVMSKLNIAELRAAADSA